MKTLTVPYLNFLSNASIEAVSIELNELERHKIDQQPWSEYAYKPTVSFSIAHSGSMLFLKYFVLESTVRVLYVQPNDPVYKDSCVEFFIAMEGDQRYYNFEFNAIGTCKLNFGTDRNNRKLIFDQAILDIRFMTSITNTSTDGNLSWQITIAIPLSTFTEHTLASFRGSAWRGNFYKCGDELPKPHFLAWNNVTAPSPDFHVPESFSDILFE